MRTTINLDDALVAEAQALAPEVRNRTELIHEGLRALIHLRSSQVLAAAAGSAGGRARAAPRPRPGAQRDGPG